MTANLQRSLRAAALAASLLLLGAGNALPVIVRSAPPEVVRSLPPEVVRSLPPVQVSNWPADSVAKWTLGVAIGAAAIALITLAAVGFQIYLARAALDLAERELKATNATLDLAKDELKATTESLVLARHELVATTDGLKVTQESNLLVQRSLNYAKEQSAYLSRRASLHLFAEGLRGRVRFYIANYVTDGNGRSARGAAVQIVVRPGGVVQFPPGGGLDFSELPDWWDGTARRKQYEITLSQVFFPGTLQYGFTLNVAAPGDESAISWRLLYDDGVTPNGGNYTPIELLAALDRSQLVAAMPPPAG